jgi:hypothetical protein
MTIARAILLCFLAVAVAHAAVTKLRSPKDERHVQMNRGKHLVIRRPRLTARVISRPLPQITVAWDPEDAAGFYVYYGGQSGIYTNSVDAGNTNVFQLTIPRGIVYLAATAYDTNGVESDFSNEVTNGLPLHPNVVVMVWQDLTNLIWIATNPTPVSQFWTGVNMSITTTNF